MREAGVSPAELEDGLEHHSGCSGSAERRHAGAARARRSAPGSPWPSTCIASPRGGGWLAAMNGIDVLAFTAGVGERAPGSAPRPRRASSFSASASISRQRRGRARRRPHCAGSEGARAGDRGPRGHRESPGRFRSSWAERPAGRRAGVTSGRDAAGHGMPGTSNRARQGTSRSHACRRGAQALVDHLAVATPMPGRQGWDKVDHVDDEVKAVHVIEHQHVEGGRGRPSSL